MELLWRERAEPDPVSGVAYQMSPSERLPWVILVETLCAGCSGWYHTHV